LWQASVGVGFSTVSIVDGKLYTMGSIAGEGDTPRYDVVWCLDIDTGNVVWQHRYPAQLIDILHEGGPAATPTVQEGRLYTMSKEGHFVCLDAQTGDLLWQRRLSDDLGVAMPTWGFSCSPLVIGNRVIVEAGRTAAYDIETGDIVWQTAAYRPAYTSPVAFRHPSTQATLVASLNNDALLILDATDGNELAQSSFTTPHATTACTPIVEGDTIYISSGYERGCTLLRFDGSNLTRVYDNQHMCNHMNSCVLHQGHLYGIDGNSHSRRTAMLKCIDHATGEIRWQQRGYGVGSLLLAGDQLVVLSDEGQLLVVRATPDAFELVAEAQVIDGKCWTVPVLCGGRLYVRNAAGDLICLQLNE
jgi:outer membrane protein assembly factor BamB